MVRETQIDSWLTDDGQYSQEKFYSHSTDGKGHSESLRTNIPPSLMAEMQKMIQAKNFPDLNSVQDVARDALYHRLHFLSTWKGDRALKRIVEFEMRNAERARKMYLLERMKFALEQTDVLLKSADEANDEMMLIEALSDARMELNSGSFMIEPWRTKMAKLINKYEKKIDNK